VSKKPEASIERKDAIAHHVAGKTWYTVERGSIGYVLKTLRLEGDEVVIEQIGEPNMKRYQLANLLIKLQHDLK